jgi:hypothetical protein
MKERDTYELFEDYLKGKLNNAEKAEFENLLQTNREVLSQFEEYRAVHQLIVESSLLDMKAQLADIHQSAQKSFRINRNIQYAVVAAVMITGVVLYYVLNKRSDIGAAQKSVPPTGQTVTYNQPNVQATPQKQLQTGQLSPKPSAISEPPKQHGDLQPKDTTIKVPVSMLAPASEKPDKKPEMTPVSSVPDQKPVKVNTASGEQKKSPEPQTVDCSNVHITCTYRIEEGCEDSRQGKIIFNKSSVKGGKPPYMYAVTDDQFDPSAVFEQLVAGRYKLMVKDDNDCLSVIGLADVKEMVCPADFIIAPERNEYWTIPYEKGQSGKLFIYTKNGNLVYASDIDQSLYPYWDGKASDGKDLSLGAYVFRIQYSNGKVLNGSVTIVK